MITDEEFENLEYGDIIEISPNSMSIFIEHGTNKEKSGFKYMDRYTLLPGIVWVSIITEVSHVIAKAKDVCKGCFVKATCKKENYIIECYKKEINE